MFHQLSVARSQIAALRFAALSYASRAMLLSMSVLSVALLNACGAATDFGASGMHVSGDATGTKSGTNNGTPTGSNTNQPDGSYASLTWFWQCDSQPVAAPKPGAGDLVLEGQGPHAIEADKLAGTKLTFAGHLCPAAPRPRDIVLVIDVSGSMEINSFGRPGSDPVQVGVDGKKTCGRLQAVQSLIAGVPAGQGNFAIVTFGSSVKKFSSSMLNNQTILFQDIAGTGDIADVVCAALDDTNYTDALVKASSILQGGRVGASKEVYFLSDGAPTLGDGVTQARSMKTAGIKLTAAPNAAAVPVTIAALMLGGTGNILRDDIASKDASGNPLYAFAADTAQLTKVLTELAANKIVRGELRYRAIKQNGGSNATMKETSINLLKYLIDDFNFSLPSFTIDVQDAPDGIEMSYEYFDKQDYRYAGGGKLVWGTESAALLEDGSNVY